MHPIVVSMWVIYTLLWVGAFFAMEAVAYLTHKYVMHGWLWGWHRSHHRVHSYWIERNDLFALIFALPSIICLAFGYFYDALIFLRYIGYGIGSYGLFYLLFHDILVHQRLPISYLPKSGYLRRMINAHHAHHTKHTKEGCESFGFLIVDRRYAPPRKSTSGRGKGALPKAKSTSVHRHQPET